MKYLFAFSLVLSQALLLEGSTSWAEGALAIGRIQNRVYWGVSHDHATVNEARIGAQNACNANGPGCSIIATFRRTCFVLAVQSVGTGYAWATRNSVVEAQNFVFSQCASGFPCQVRSSFCDVVDEAALAAQRRVAEQQAAEQARQQLQAEQQAAQQARQQRLAEQQAAEQARQQRRAEQEAADQARQQRQAEQDASERQRVFEFQTQQLRSLFTSPVAQLVIAVFVPMVLIILKRVIGGESEKENVIKRIFVGTASSTIAALILHGVGVTSEVTLLSVPIVGGLILGLSYDRLHA